MSLTVVESTDNKYLGLTMPLDPRNPPDGLTTPDGIAFHPISWDEISPGRWRIWSYNYIVIAQES